jgi:hypothetical protein
MYELYKRTNNQIVQSDPDLVPFMENEIQAYVEMGAIIEQWNAANSAQCPNSASRMPYQEHRVPDKWVRWLVSGQRSLFLRFTERAQHIL